MSDPMRFLLPVCALIVVLVFIVLFARAAWEGSPECVGFARAAWHWGRLFWRLRRR
jgi:hypothetical protein